MNRKTKLPVNALKWAEHVSEFNRDFIKSHNKA